MCQCVSVFVKYDKCLLANRPEEPDKKRESGTNLSANQTRLINNGWARPDGLILSHSDPMKVQMQSALCRLELLF